MTCRIEKIENNNIIPEKQFTDGTQYISSSMRSIIIPVVKNIKI